MIAGKLDPITGARMQLPIGGCLTPASRANSSIAIVNRVTCLERSRRIQNSSSTIGGVAWETERGTGSLAAILPCHPAFRGEIVVGKSCRDTVDASHSFPTFLYIYFFRCYWKYCIKIPVKKLPFRSFSLNNSMNYTYKTFIFYKRKKICWTILKSISLFWYFNPLTVHLLIPHLYFPSLNFLTNTTFKFGHSMLYEILKKIKCK